MDSRRVLTAGLFNFSLAVIAGLFGITQTMGDALGFDPFERSFWLDLLNRSEPLRTLVMTHQIVAVIGGSILLDPAWYRHGPGPHHPSRIWLPPRSDRDRLPPPPRPADPDRRHHSSQAGAGRDPRQRPNPRALRLVGAEAAKPCPGRRQGRPCRRPASQREGSRRDPHLARLADRARRHHMAFRLPRLRHLIHRRPGPRFACGNHFVPVSGSSRAAMASRRITGGSDALAGMATDALCARCRQPFRRVRLVASSPQHFACAQDPEHRPDRELLEPRVRYLHAEARRGRRKWLFRSPCARH